MDQKRSSGEDGGDNWLRVLTPQGKVFDFAQNIKPVDLHLVDWNSCQMNAPVSILPDRFRTALLHLAGPRYAAG